jgi:hypothetical protein
MVPVITSCHTTIFVTTSFEGIHCYPDAPDEVAFLRSPHRHIFHVKATIEVFHDDRELEFILVKRGLDKFLTGTDLQHRSCEMIAHNVIGYLNSCYGVRNCSVEVSEDLENGATVTQRISS